MHIIHIIEHYWIHTLCVGVVAMPLIGMLIAELTTKDYELKRVTHE